MQDNKKGQDIKRKKFLFSYFHGSFNKKWTIMFSQCLFKNQRLPRLLEAVSWQQHKMINRNKCKTQDNKLLLLDEIWDLSSRKSLKKAKTNKKSIRESFYDSFHLNFSQKVSFEPKFIVVVMIVLKLKYIL